MESALAEAGAAIDLRLMRVAALLDSDPRAAARGAAQILEEHPRHPAATLLLGTAHRSCGDPRAAAAALVELAAAQPDSAVIQLELGRTLAAQGRDADALTALARAVELEPNLAEAWRELAAMHAARGDTGACDVAYARFTRLALPEQRHSEAGVALANNRLATAESLLRRELAHSPQDVAAMRMLA